MLMEEHRLRTSENRMLRRIFGPKRDEMTGDWRNVHNEELHNMCSSPSIIRLITSWRMNKHSIGLSASIKRGNFLIW
jgi:hypothetical protein